MIRPLTAARDLSAGGGVIFDRIVLTPIELVSLSDRVSPALVRSELVRGAEGRERPSEKAWVRVCPRV